MERDNMIKNIVILILFLGLVLTISLNFNHKKGDVTVEQSTKEMDRSSYTPPFKVIFIAHDYGADFFRPVEQGMNDACKLVNAECMFIGPAQFSPREQIALIEASIAQQPNVIVTTRAGPGELYTSAIRKALDANINVMIFNTNIPSAQSSIPLPFFGQDLSNYGEIWAKEVMRDLPDGGDIAILHATPGHYATELRLSSFQKYLAENGQGKWTIRDVLSPATQDEDKLLAVIKAYHEENPDIKAIYGDDYYSHLLAIYVGRNNLKGKLKIGGADLGPGFIEGLDKGYVSFALDQTPYLQGFQPVISAFLLTQKGIKIDHIDTGTTVIRPVHK
ncbi:MAG: hypothetical protein COA90_09295 [Gammaproteobacteria bacterium]|nr:MAG: hypothetical protein COA90_09295 [Gammaproteobacteria bacterium]